jgi:starch synthase (maltosyl-transferring)
MKEDLGRPRAGRNHTGGARIYYVSPLQIGPLEQWNKIFHAAREMGFSHVCLAPLFAPAASGDIFLIDDYERTNPTLKLPEVADAAVSELANLAREAGVHLLLDLVLDRVAADGALARSAPHWFYRVVGADVIDPREAQLGAEAAPARFEDPQRQKELIAWWVDRIIRLAKAGAAGFRLLGLADVPGRFVTAVVEGVRQEWPFSLFFGWTPGVPWRQFASLESAGLDAVFASTA